MHREEVLVFVQLLPLVAVATPLQALHPSSPWVSQSFSLVDRQHHPLLLHLNHTKSYFHIGLVFRERASIASTFLAGNVDSDGLPGFKSQVQLGASVCGLGGEGCGFFLQVLEVVLEGDVEVEGVGAVGEPDPDVRLPSRVLDAHHKVA